jgi:release factor glutamine methyltransferase
VTSLPAALLRVAERRLAEAGVPSPRYDAELLLDLALGSRTARFTVHSVNPSTVDSYLRLVERRAGREPLQHIVGTAAFRRLTLAVGPGVFVPRPETELLVEWGLSVLSGQSTVVDLCAGSGAVGLSVAAERRAARVYLVESDPVALGWLRRNAAGYPTATVLAGDATSTEVLSELDGAVDLVLANPPYVPTGTALPPEVEHDPPVALWGGPDGLSVLAGVAGRAAGLLRPGGRLGVEHDQAHAAGVRALLGRRGFAEVASRTDLAGRPRFCTARKPVSHHP